MNDLEWANIVRELERYVASESPTVNMRAVTGLEIGLNLALQYPELAQALKDKSDAMADRRPHLTRARELRDDWLGEFAERHPLPSPQKGASTV